MDLLYNDDEQTEKTRTFPGVTVAIVTDINDPEKRGRVKVKIVNRDSSDYETDYIRVMTPMTGKQWGSFFFPEVGDEVLIAFNQGDINRPYVLGSLWNKEYKPPTTIENQKNDLRMIRTRSGHELIFNDEKSKESILIKTPKALSISLNDDKETIVIKDKAGKNIMTIDSKNGQITVTANKKMTLQSGKSNVILDAQKDSLNIESSSSIQIKSQQISIRAASTLELKAGSSLSVKCDGPTTVKGATVKIN
ncbi:phage baseplate assembly protein V [Heliorestis acidaminivorans]|nr:phage baseplate assembly protein V [Heliorestis acidaminivorans]